MQKGTLNFSNATMDFYAANILVQNGGALQATGIGANGETLIIHLYGNPTTILLLWRNCVRNATTISPF